MYSTRGYNGVSLHRPPHPHDLPRHRRLPPHGPERLRRPSASRPSGPASTAAPPRASATTSATSPKSSRSAPPSSASATTAGSASTPRRPRTSRCRARSSPSSPSTSTSPTSSASAKSASTRTPRNEATIFQEHVDLAMTHRRADPHPHAAPGGQVQGHADDPRHAQERPPRQAGARLHRSRRGAHRPPRPGRRLLVRHDALPDDEMHAGAGRRHPRDGRHRAHHGQLGRRLGQVRPAGRAGVHPGNAPPRPRRGADPQGGVREPAGVLAAVRALAGMAGRGQGIGERGGRERQQRV